MQVSLSRAFWWPPAASRMRRPQSRHQPAHASDSAPHACALNYVMTQGSHSPSMTSTITLRVINAIGDVTPAAWDACANPALEAGAKPDYNPFISHDFLSSLELSGAVRNRAGWQPMHLLAEAGGEVVGAVLCYAKSHSQGEYVFDHGWADAYERAGGNYYPKLQV